MSALDEIHRKLLDELDDIEIAIWYTSGATSAYDMEKAAAELAALRARVEKLEAGIFNMRKCVAENAGIRNEYQDFEEVFEIAQNLLGDIPSEAK